MAAPSNNSNYELYFPNTASCLWQLALPNVETRLAFAPPVAEIDGRAVTLLGPLTPLGEPVILPHGPVEQTLSAPVAGQAGLALRLVLRIAPGCPVVRFRYELHSAAPRRLTKTGGGDSLTYLSVSLVGFPRVTEVQLSQFNEMVHSFCLQENPIVEGDFAASRPVMGPILTAESDSHCLLLAYEHGSQVPDAFIQFALAPERTVTLEAVKGNYATGQSVDASHPFSTVWMQAALMAGTQADVAADYREFLLRHLSPNTASRQPDIFYNTWNYQERSKAWECKDYLTPMHQERVLAEIDAAHRMGVDVFVLDTGWYEKTGDWQVNLARFPDGLKSVKARLDRYGMKLGLWFNPTAAAVSSTLFADHPECRISRGGKAVGPWQVWETEESVFLCLVSRYWEAFADALIRLHQEVGVTYFKWDAIEQYGCDDPNHLHGTEENTPQERADRYAFEQVGYMGRVVDKLCAACPEAVVDFDITEGGRSVGLSFLSAGKYFLINNGPYSFNYNMPTPADGNVNLFFYPGPARAWVCRTPLTYDKWIPSVLLLTHYLPDDSYTVWGSNPREVRSDANQWISLASLVLGQNGIWGDLLGVSEEGQIRMGTALAAYKQVREEITSTALIRTGAVGGSPEVYEKLSNSGRGVVSLFASATGSYTYVTQVPVAPGLWHSPGVVVRTGADGHAILKATFDGPGARIVFFGVSAATDDSF